MRIFRQISDNWWKVKMRLQEVLYGHPNYAEWEVDTYFVEKLRGPFKGYKKTWDDDQEIVCPPYEMSRLSWMCILDTVEFAFDNCGNEFKHATEWHEKNDKKGSKDYLEYMNNRKPTPKYIRDKDAKDIKKIQKGFELFGKYVQCFWE